MQEIIGIIVAVLTVVCVILYITWQIKKKGLKGFAIDMIIKAEKMYKKGQNSEKMKYVINATRSFLKTTKIGAILSLVVTDDMIRGFVQDVFDGLKKALDYTPEK